MDTEVLQRILAGLDDLRKQVSSQTSKITRLEAAQAAQARPEADPEEEEEVEVVKVVPPAGPVGLTRKRGRHAPAEKQVGLVPYTIVSMCLTPPCSAYIVTIH